MREKKEKLKESLKKILPIKLFSQKPRPNERSIEGPAKPTGKWQFDFEVM